MNKEMIKMLFMAGRIHISDYIKLINDNNKLFNDIIVTMVDWFTKLFIMNIISVFIYSYIRGISVINIWLYVTLILHIFLLPVYLNYKISEITTKYIDVAFNHIQEVIRKRKTLLNKYRHKLEGYIIYEIEDDLTEIEDEVNILMGIYIDMMESYKRLLFYTGYFLYIKHIYKGLIKFFKIKEYLELKVRKDMTMSQMSSKLDKIMVANILLYYTKEESDIMKYIRAYQDEVRNL